MSAVATSLSSLDRTAAHLVRTAMVSIFLVFGLHKFDAVTEMGIAGFIGSSPLTSWLNLFGAERAVMIVGVSELAFGLLLAVGFWRPESRLAIAGAMGSTITYLTTLSFMLTTPGVFGPNGPPLLSGGIGLFLVKDVVLLAASVQLLVQGLAHRQDSARDASGWAWTRPSVVRTEQGLSPASNLPA